MDVSSGSRVETQFVSGGGGGDAPLAGGGVARVSCVAGAEEAERHRNREQLTRPGRTTDPSTAVLGVAEARTMRARRNDAPVHHPVSPSSLSRPQSRVVTMRTEARAGRGGASVLRPLTVLSCAGGVRLAQLAEAGGAAAAGDGGAAPAVLLLPQGGAADRDALGAGDAAGHARDAASAAAGHRHLGGAGLLGPRRGGEETTEWEAMSQRDDDKGIREGKRLKNN